MDDLLATLQGAAGNYKPAFDASKSYGTPVALLDNLKNTESSGNNYAINKQTKAMGPYQFMPETVAMLHKQGIKFDPFDEQQSRAAADYYLSNLTQQNGGDLNKAVAQYGGFKNADPSGYVGKVMKGVNAPQQAQNQQVGVTGDLVSTLSQIGDTAPSSKPAITLKSNAPATTQTPSTVAAVGAGIGKGFGSLVLGGQDLVGHGIQAASNILPDSVSGDVKSAGDWLVKDAQTGIKNLESQNAPYQSAHPIANTSGEIGGNLSGALMIPAGSAANEANFVGRLINAAKTGAAFGVISPTEDTGSASQYWGNKAVQGIAGGAAGLIAQPVAEVAGKVIGNVANSGVNLVKNVYNKLTGAGISDDLAKSIGKASPELQQSVVNSVSKGEKIDPAALQRQVEADSLPIKMSLTAGQAKQDPIAISNELNLRSKNPAMVFKLNDQNSQLVQNLDHIRDAGAPDAIAPDHITAGETLIDAAKNVINTQGAKTSALYKQLEQANGGSLPMNGQDFAIQANQALGKSMKAPFLPGQVQSIITDLQTGKHPMTFENFENLRTILASEARKADRAGDGNAMAAINTVRNTLENMPMSNEAGNVKQLADAARASAKQGFDMLRANPALAAIDSGKAVADNFVQKYVVNANKSDLMNLATTLKDDPQALQTMKAGVVNYLKNQAVGQTGNFSQSAYNKGLQALGPKLDVLFSPEESQALRTLGNVAKYTQIQPKGSYVNNSNTDVANLARTGGNLAAHALDAATHSPAGSIINNVVSNSIDSKATAAELRRTLNPGAGIGTEGRLRDLLNRKLPIALGKVAVPLTSIGLVNDAKGGVQPR